MTRVAFGPPTTSPSWDWVGLGTATELRRWFEIEIFEDFSRVPSADIVVVIKIPPPLPFVHAVQAKGARLAFVPIDRYSTPAEIAQDSELLAATDLVILHSEPLRPYLAPFCKRIARVEHHAKYALERPSAYKSSGFVLWVGGCEHVPHVVQWLEENDSLASVKLLTNIHDRPARIAAHLRAYEIGVRLKFSESTINGYEVLPWSEDLQRSMMMECRAAIDIKGQDFSQMTKPPTKAQQFIVSGIPFGCNPDSSIAAYFKTLDFDVADARDSARLLSRQYWEETGVISAKLRALISLDPVARTYAQDLLSLTGKGPLYTPPNGL